MDISNLPIVQHVGGPGIDKCRLTLQSSRRSFCQAASEGIIVRSRAGLVIVAFLFFFFSAGIPSTLTSSIMLPTCVMIQRRWVNGYNDAFDLLGCSWREASYLFVRAIDWTKLQWLSKAGTMGLKWALFHNSAMALNAVWGMLVRSINKEKMYTIKIAMHMIPIKATITLDIYCLFLPSYRIIKPTVVPGKILY